MSSAYDNEAYMKSLHGSQNDIQRSVMNAIGEINKQKAAAQAAALKIGTQAGVAVDEGNTNMNTSLAALGAGGQTEAQLAAWETMRSGYKDIGTLMHKGFGEDATRQYGAAQGIGTELSNQVSQKKAEYISQRTREDAARRAQEQEAARARALSMELASRQEAMQRAGIAAQQRQFDQSRADQLAFYASQNPGGRAPGGGGIGLSPTDRPAYNAAMKKAMSSPGSFYASSSPAGRMIFSGAMKVAASDPNKALSMFNSLPLVERMSLQGMLGRTLLDPKYANSVRTGISNYSRNTSSRRRR